MDKTEKALRALLAEVLPTLEEWSDQFDPSDETYADVKAARDRHRDMTERVRLEAQTIDSELCHRQCGG